MAQIGLKQLDSVLTGSLQVSGSVGVTGSLAVSSIAGDLVVPQYIIHEDDPNTYLNFTPDRLRFNIGGISYIDLNDAGSAPHDLTFNDGGNDLDFIIKGSSDNPLFKADASTNRIGTNGQGTPSADFHIGGNLKVQSHITGSGNISGSSASTGSFGTLETVGEINASGRIYEAGSSVIDHATAMAIVFGG